MSLTVVLYIIATPSVIFRSMVQWAIWGNSWPPRNAWAWLCLQRWSVILYN